MKVRFFRTPSEFGRWLAKNHDRENELWVGFYKKATGRATITFPDALDEALCWGWIDGIRKSVDEISYTNRFTPRRAGSNWSAINIGRAKELIAEGRMQPPGLRAFEARRDDRAAASAFDRGKAPKLDEAHEAHFRAARDAWTFFEAQPPGYRRLALGWVISAKREDTRLRRLEKLIALSAAGKRLA
ncbi:MAG: YdeI/OmpD-associated family protein [Thermoanaerobaculia bacterium]